MDYKNDCTIKFMGDLVPYHFLFDEKYLGAFYSIIDLKELGEKFGKELLAEHGENIKGEDRIDYDIETILTYIEEEHINDVRNKIFDYVVEYLDDNLE